MQQPKKTKYRKCFKGRIKGKAQKGNYISFGEYAVKALTSERITSRQIEAARKVIKGYTDRKGKLWIRIFAHKPVTKKPADTRMGSGKGSVEYWVAPVKPGTVLFELSGVPIEVAKGAFDRASAKLPVKTKFMVSND